MCTTLSPIFGSVRRKHSKKKNIGQQNLLPLVRESVINNSEITTSEAPTQILPTSISYDQLVEVQHSVPLLVYRESKPLDSSRVLPKVYTIRGGTHLANVQEASADVQVMHSLLSLRPNYAYNRRHDLPGLDSHQDSTNQQSQTTTHDGRLLFNQRQISVHHYDYPKVQEHLCAGDTDSLGYQSIM